MQHTIKSMCTLAVTLITFGSLTGGANAATVVVNGTTVGGPLWHRPVALSGSLSGPGKSVPYQVLPFTVDVSGNYDFLAIAIDPLNWDNYSFIYHTSFNPTSPLANRLVANDDFPSEGRTGFNAVPLIGNTTYFYVHTGFGNNDFGTYELTVTGPGTFAVVPESSSFALLAGSLGIIALRRARKK